MASRHDPGFIGNPRRVRAQGNKVASHFQHALILLQFLRNDVAEDTAFLLLEVIAAGSQLIEHAPRHEGGRGELGCRMFELLPSAGSVILEDADVFEASVAFQILNSMGNQQKELFDFGVARVPQMPVVPGVLD